MFDKESETIYDILCKLQSVRRTEVDFIGFIIAADRAYTIMIAGQHNDFTVHIGIGGS